MLAALTCFFNPLHDIYMLRNMERFLDMFEGADLFVAEATFDGKFALSGTHLALHADQRHLMWQKERLLNLLIERLPRRYDRIAWIDGDLLILHSDWASETERKLKHAPVVQLFQNIHLLDSNHRITNSRLGRIYHAKLHEGDYSKGAIGAAWAARREVVREGLYDRHILGSGDALALRAWGGEYPLRREMHPGEGLMRDWQRWAREVRPRVSGNFDYLEGDLLHWYHGSKSLRGYSTRNAILVRHQFDPRQDIERDPQNGLWRFASEKRGMHQEIADYFLQRQAEYRGG